MIERFYLGTWQFEGLNGAESSRLIETAHNVGIHKFDTAAVYDGGNAEALLGRHSIDGDQVATKLPATSKHETNILLAYPEDHIARHLESSAKRLKGMLHTVLLHNWHNEWEDGIQPLLDNVRLIARDYGIHDIGISLPNNYTGRVEHSDVYGQINTIELPLNDESPALTHERIANIALTKHVLVRSLFKHGSDVSNMNMKIKDALDTGADIIIGASKPEQIKSWGEAWK